MFRDGSSEGSPADNDYVECAFPAGNGLCGAVKCFLQGIAEVPPHVVQGERGPFRSQRLGHIYPPDLFQPLQETVNPALNNRACLRSWNFQTLSASGYTKVNLFPHLGVSF
jgi:hypothetical protein